MIFEVCKETGWSIEYILEMPVRRFFAIRKSMYEIKREEHYNKLMELCDIQFIGVAKPNYYQELRDFYRSQIKPDQAKKRLNIRQFDSENEGDRRKVDDILQATFRQKAKLMGLKLNG